MKQSNYIKFIQQYDTKMRELHNQRTEALNKLTNDERQQLLNQKELLDGETTYFPDGRVKSFTCFTYPSNVKNTTNSNMDYGGIGSISTSIEQGSHLRTKIRIEVLDYGDYVTKDNDEQEIGE